MVENAIFSTNDQPPLWRHIVVTVVITGLVCALSMSTDCLGIVLELNVSISVIPDIFNNNNRNVGMLFHGYVSVQFVVWNCILAVPKSRV